MSASESFGRSGFAQFISSPAGRVARIVAGLILIALGYRSRAGAGGIVLIVVGFIPLLAGLFDLCVISGLLGGPLSGSRIRALRK
jgi:hypothetical protein